MPEIGKIVDAGKIPGYSDLDKFWKDRKWPQIVFSIDNKKVRQGIRISDVYLQQLSKAADIPKFLMSWYGIRGFEFGNWTTEEDRMNYMLGMAASLHDLQQLLGFERHQVGLGGMLSITFGSRGVPNASGTFDFYDFTINLSRHSKRAFKSFDEESRREIYTHALMSRGLQAMVHEYGHALDYYAGSYIEKTKSGSLSGGSTRSRDVEIKGRLGELTNQMLDKLLYRPDGSDSAFRARLRKNGRHQYLMQRNEVFARAFEKYIAYKLKTRGWFNVYFTKFKLQGKDNAGRDKYPTDNELKAIEKDFDKLITELRRSIKVKAGKKVNISEDLPALTDRTITLAELISRPEVAAINFPVSEIYTDTARFQNRDEEYSQESVMRIVENFDPTRLGAVVLWKDPKDGKVYILSGHSRLKAHKIMGKEFIPSTFFNGTEEQAIRFAKVYANRDNTPETIAEDIKAYVRMRDEEKAKPEKLKRTFRHWQKLDAWSFLNPRGKFLLTLSSDARTQFPYLENKALWVGLLREQLPQLTNLHEDEMFDFLFGAKGLQIKRDDFINMVQSRVQRIDFDPDHALLLNSEGKTGTAARGDTSDAQEQIHQLTLENKKLQEQMRKARTKAEKEELRKLITANGEEMERIANGIRTALRTQTALFGDDGKISRKKLISLLQEHVKALTLAKLDSVIEQLKFYLQAFKAVSKNELRKVGFDSNLDFYQRQIEKKFIEAAIARNALNERENHVPGQMALFGPGEDPVASLAAGYLALDGRTLTQKEFKRLIAKYKPCRRKAVIKPIYDQLVKLQNEFANMPIKVRIKKPMRVELIDQLHGLGFLPMIAQSFSNAFAFKTMEKLLNRKKKEEINGVDTKFPNTKKLIEFLEKKSNVTQGNVSTNPEGRRYRYDEYVTKHNAFNSEVKLFYKAAEENGAKNQRSFQHSLYAFHFQKGIFKNSPNGKISMHRLVILDEGPQVDGIFDDIKAGVKKIAEKAAPIAKKIREKATPVINQVVDRTKPLVKKAIDKTKEKAAPAIEKVKRRIHEKLNKPFRVKWVDAAWNDGGKEFKTLPEAETFYESARKKFYLVSLEELQGKNDWKELKYDDRKPGENSALALSGPGTKPNPFRRIDELEKGETFRLKGPLGEFLGDLERIKLGITLDGDPGGGKSPFAYQLANAFADIGMNVDLYSLEMGANGNTIAKYRDMNIRPENFKRIRITGEAAEGLKTIEEFAKDADVIIIDSWKLLFAKNSEFNSLREKYPDKIWIAIFQLTSSGDPRGGPEAHFDAGINIHVVKVDRTFKNNYAFCDKNRYGPTGIQYNISAQKIVPEDEEKEEQENTGETGAAAEQENKTSAVQPELNFEEIANA